MRVVKPAGGTWALTTDQGTVLIRLAQTETQPRDATEARRVLLARLKERGKKR